MSANILLYQVTLVLLLDNEGHRLFAKYYHDEDHASLAQQRKFEQTLFPKINKVNEDILLYDNHLVAYKQVNDVLVVVVAKINENESLIYSVCANLTEALTILLDNSLDKNTVVEKYDMVSLAIDETVDDGIIIEIDPAIIVSRVTNPPVANAVDNIKIDISERGLFNAFSFATKKIGERLQQGI